MNLLEKLKVSASDVERVEVILLSVKALGSTRWDKDSKQMVARTANSADTLIVFKVGDDLYTKSCYAKNCFQHGLPIVGLNGVAAVIGLKANKDVTQEPNVIDVVVDTTGITSAQASLMIASKNTLSFD